MHASHNNLKFATFQNFNLKPITCSPNTKLWNPKTLQFEWINERQWKIEPNDLMNCDKMRLGDKVQDFKFWSNYECLTILKSNSH